MGAASSFCRDCFQDSETEMLETMRELKDVEAQEHTLVAALDQLQQGRDTLPKSVESNILALTSNLQTLAQLKLALGARISALQSKNQLEGRRRVVELVKESERVEIEVGDEGLDDGKRIDALDAGSIETQLVAIGDKARDKIRATATTLGVSNPTDTLALARDILGRHGKKAVLKTVPEERAPLVTDPTATDEEDEEILVSKHDERALSARDDVPLIA